MALIKCAECGKEFSDKAPACPNCGCPTSEIVGTKSGGSVNFEAEKQMLALVEETLEKARKASAAYELEADEVQKLAGSTNINLLGSSVRQDTSRIVEAAVNACDALYSAYQALIPTLDGGCRPLLAQNPGAKAVKAVAGTIAWLNDESEIENNYAINFNGANLGNAVKAKYIPNPVNRAIQGFWEAEYAKLQNHSEAESFWTDLLDEHKEKALKAEQAARRKAVDDTLKMMECRAEARESVKKQQAVEEEERRKRYVEQSDQILDRLEYFRPAKDLLCFNESGYAFLSGGRITVNAMFTGASAEDSPRDTSAMSNLCGVAVNNVCVFGLTREGNVVISKLEKKTMEKYGYTVCAGWRGIKKIACTDRCVVGLRYDGTCVGTRFKSGEYFTYYGEGSVSDWRDVEDIVCGGHFTAGLRADGTVCYAGTTTDKASDLAKCKSWRDIILLKADYNQLIGLKKNGTLVQIGNWNLSPLSAAKDIVDITMMSGDIMALQADGDLVIPKKAFLTNEKVGYAVSSVKDALAINRGTFGLFILKKNGNLEKHFYVSGDLSPFSRSPDIEGRLFQDYDSFQKAEKKRLQEQKEADRQHREEEALRADRRAKNLCQHCGGILEKKLFGWKCKSCGQRKDY